MEFIILAVVVVVGFKINLMGFEMMQERRDAERAGTHDYYGNKIK